MATAAMASSPPAATRSPPTRTKSEGDTIDSLSSEDTKPPLLRVNSFTFVPKKRNKFMTDRNTKKKWVFAAQKTKNIKDPWETLGIENLLEESVTRHMYNPKNKKWKVDEVVVKVETEVSCNLFNNLLSGFRDCRL